MLKKLAIIAGALCALAPAASAIDVCGNGGFEMQGFDGPSYALFFGRVQGGAAGTISERTDVNPISGSYSMHIVAVGGPGQGGTAGVIQNTYDTGIVSLAPGSTATLSFDERGNAGPGGVGFYSLRILNSAGAIVANTGLNVYFPGNGVVHHTSASLTVPAFGAAPNDAYYAFTEIVVAAGAFDGSIISATLDNVKIEGTLNVTTAPCPADFNQDGGVDGGDVDSFFGSWESGSSDADVNQDGGVDGGDISTFFAAWEAGGC
jgi:hypothetical protein